MDTAIQLRIVLVISLFLGIRGYLFKSQVKRSSAPFRNTPLNSVMLPGTEKLPRLAGKLRRVYDVCSTKIADILCRSCEDVQWPELCITTQTCGNNQTCFTQEYRDKFGRRAYRLGCQPRQVCQHYHQGSIAGRKRQSRSHLCHQCCDRTDCNWRLCHAFGWPTTFAIVSPTTPTLGFLGCNFDWDTCGWRQLKSDDFDWSRHSGSTPSGAEPHSDHTTQSGYYMYIDTSAPRREGEKVQLQSQSWVYQSGFAHCLKFWYIMNGADVGTLEVSINPMTTLWSKSGDQGSGWSSASVALPHGDITVTITAVVGKGGRGVIAIDDIASTFGQCV